ncbi:hypothetical protein AB4K20DRAFT_1868402 [Rhizopus microsporus]
MYSNKRIILQNVTETIIRELDHSIKLHSKLAHKSTKKIHKEDNGFQCPKCKSKLKNPSTFSKHIKDQHNGTCKPISKNKHKRTRDQTGSEEDSGSDEESSVTLKHQKITKPQLNVNTDILYSSSSSFTRLDYDSAVLMASSALSLQLALTPNCYCYLLLEDFYI